MLCSLRLSPSSLTIGGGGVGKYELVLGRCSSIIALDEGPGTGSEGTVSLRASELLNRRVYTAPLPPPILVKKSLENNSLVSGK